MASSSVQASPSAGPAWKRLGLVLKNNSPGTQVVSTSPADLPQSRSVQADLDTPIAAPRGGNKRKATDMLESSPSAARTGKSSKRTRAVSFASEVKHNDGDETEQIFENWAKDQQGGDDQFTPAEAAQFLPPKAHPANQNPKTSKKSTKTKTQEPKKVKAKEKKPRTALVVSIPQGPLAYVTYLEQFHTSRGSWKFNKSKQTDLLQNIFNVFRVPPSQDPAIIDYLKGLQGEGARQRLREKAQAILKETEADSMANTDILAQAREDALRHHLKSAKQQLRHDAEVEEEESETFLIKMRQRKRAKAVLDTIGRELKAEGVKTVTDTSLDESREPGFKRRKTRMRNIRTGIPDDDNGSAASSVESIPSSDGSDASSSSSSSESEDEDDNEDGSGEGSSDSDSDEVSSTSSSSSSSSSSSNDEGEESGSD
jgi:hypothetical protein